MFKIRKKFRVEYAHQLVSSFSKPCQTLHGHSAVIEVFLESKYLHEDSMVVDFGKIKNMIKEYIDSFDHALILHQDIPSEYLGMLEKYNDPRRIKLVPYNPTAEEMAKDICQTIRKSINQSWKESNQIKLSVRFHETETGYAEYSEDLI